MPKMRGLLRPRPKVDEEEMALAQSRAVARLAVLLGDSAGAPAEAPPDGDARPDAIEEHQGDEPSVTPASAPAGARPRPRRHRPPIVVEGDAEPIGDRDGRRPELVGVMARSQDDASDGSWELLLGDVTKLALEPGLRDSKTTEGAAVESNTATPGRPVRRRSRPDDPSRSGEASSPGGRSPATRSPARRSPARRTTRTRTRAAPVPAAFCPYCALLLQPPPVSSRRCERCRQKIVVKRAEGRAVYLTEAAVLVFEVERRRVASSGRLTRERDRWLRLATESGAPAQAQARLVAAPLSDEVVAAARALYVTTVDRAFRAAKRSHEWETASRIRRDQATAMFRAARSPKPPPADLVALFREGVAAELRGVAEISRDAQLVSAACCDVCRADDRQIFRIAHELRAPRLPHEGCPRGLCRCSWDLAARDRTTMRRYLRRRPRTEPPAATNEPAPTA